MGADIHMFIVKDNKVDKQIFDDGMRNYEWFDNICHQGYDRVYDFFPCEIISKDSLPEGISKKESEYGYGFRKISVKDFCEWFEEYRPDIDAGWVNTYDKWLYESKGILPQELPKFREENEPDMYFIEVINTYDLSAELYTILRDGHYEGEDEIIYFFNR